MREFRNDAYSNAEESILSLTSSILNSPCKIFYLFIYSFFYWNRQQIDSFHKQWLEHIWVVSEKLKGFCVRSITHEEIWCRWWDKWWNEKWLKVECLWSLDYIVNCHVVSADQLKCTIMSFFNPATAKVETLPLDLFKKRFTFKNKSQCPAACLLTPCDAIIYSITSLCIVVLL